MLSLYLSSSDQIRSLHIFSYIDWISDLYTYIPSDRMVINSRDRICIITLFNPISTHILVQRSDIRSLQIYFVRSDEYMVCRLVIYSGIISSDLYTYISSDRINIYARDRICTYTFSIRSLHIFLYRDRISDLYSYILSDRINIWYRDQFWMLCRIVR